MVYLIHCGTRRALRAWTRATLAGLAVVATFFASIGNAAQSQPGPARPATQQPALAKVPEYTSSVQSVQIDSVSLVQDLSWPALRVQLRNLSSETVIGIEFEIKGSDPFSSSSFATLTQLQAAVFLPVIEPTCEGVIDIPTDNFTTGDTLRFAAVLFDSGRGEGDVELVDELRREASASQPPVPQVRAPN